MTLSWAFGWIRLRRSNKFAIVPQADAGVGVSYAVIGKIWLVALYAPGIVPAVILYRRHCKDRPRGASRFPIILYVFALLICAFVAFWGGADWGVRFACSRASSGNLCGLLGIIIVGPLSSIVAVSVLSWLITRFPSQTKSLAFAGVALFVLAEAYHFRGFSFDNVAQPTLYRYTIQSSNLDELHRFAPLIEAQMKRLPALKEVTLDSQVNGHQGIVKSDQQRAATVGAVEPPIGTTTISFSLAPGADLDEAVSQIQVMTNRLALPVTITTSFTKAP